MVKFKNSIWINAPVEKVFSEFNNESLRPKWLLNYQKRELVESNEHIVGSRYKVTFLERGRELEMFQTITAYKKDDVVAFNLEHKAMSSHTQILFEDHNGKTELIASTIARGKGFWKLILPFMQPLMKARQQHDYERLKTLVEQSQQPY